MFYLKDAKVRVDILAEGSLNNFRIIWFDTKSCLGSKITLNKGQIREIWCKQQSTVNPPPLNQTLCDEGVLVMKTPPSSLLFLNPIVSLVWWNQWWRVQVTGVSASTVMLCRHQLYWRLFREVTGRAMPFLGKSTHEPSVRPFQNKCDLLSCPSNWWKSGD